MNRARGLAALLVLLAVIAPGCGDGEPPVNRVGVNVVEKSVFTGSWYLSRTVVDVDYEGGGFGTFPGDAAYDFVGSDLASMPRIRWVIEEKFLYAFRDYELLEGGDGEPRTPGEHFGLPVAAFAVESHFDIRRSYNPTTGEEQNVIVENTTDRNWYDRQYMRVDWSKNLLPGYYGQSAELNEIFGIYEREPADLYVQDQSEFPESWKPSFDHMTCDGLDDEGEDCHVMDRDWASDYAKDELYHMSFVTQEVLSPGTVPDPFTGTPVNFCLTAYSDAPGCTNVAVFIRNSFLKVSETRQYEPVNWADTRFDRHGFFRLERPTYDRSLGPDDPMHGATDFLNYSVNRHNLWRRWRDEAGNPIPFRDREVRPVIWYTTPELPAHLVKPSFELVSEWNGVLMSSIRHLRGQDDAEYPRVSCQTDDPDAYCYCQQDPANPGDVLNATCAGRYDPFLTPEQQTARGAVAPYDCWVEVGAAAEPNLADDAVASRLRDADFNGWFGATMRGTECANVLRANTCNRASIAENGGTSDGLECQQRGDMRFKFLSYVDQPGTAFLGIATLRGDPVTGELLTGDANIGGPALDSYRTAALQQYDLIHGDLSEQDFLTGEDVRSYLEALEDVQLPAPPRVDFNVALSLGGANAADRAAIDRQMTRAMTRISKLQGAQGRANTFSDRLQALVGTDIERRLVENEETLVRAGIDRLPENAGASDVSDALLDQVSPVRGNAHRVLANFDAMEARIGKHNVTMPNEYIDDSVAWYVDRHADWPRARLEYGLNRALYYETQLHEMGHCLGLRHDFGASADTGNYFDDYYEINARVPLPDPREFDVDGTTGLDVEEQREYEDAYTEARSRRELAGIDRYMSSSVMEYTANWYQRTQTQAGRYDRAALAFAYGDLVEVYDNAEGRTLDAITPANTPRRYFKYYQGGEVCEADADCPSNVGGARAADLLQTNLDAGVTQRCVANPRGGASAKMCSSFDDDLAAIATGASPEWVPVSYRFCTDERAAGGGDTVGSIGWCHRFDEGDSYREIVRNVAESYDRMYLFTNFRRYRRNYSFATLTNNLLGRRFIILQNIYQNLIFQYVSDPAFRSEPGAFGFYDEFMATADILNLYARVLGQPDVGCFAWDEGWQRYDRVNAAEGSAACDLYAPLGMGRYVSSVYQRGLSGIKRIERIGTFYDKMFTLQLMSLRGFQPDYTRDVPFYTNFYDLFPLEMQQIVSGMIRAAPEEYAPRVSCSGGEFPDCEEPRITYMDFYRGDCSDPDDTSVCRPDPVQTTYRDEPVLAGGSHFLLQYLATIYGLSEFPVFFDTTFQNQLFVCVEGQGDCHAPGGTAVEGVDYVRYDSPRYGKSFLAWQVEPTEAVRNQTSIGFALVTEAKNLDFILRALRTYRGDFGGAAYSASNLSSDQTEGLDELEYEIPADDGSVDAEIDRVDGRVLDLESFFNQLIQVEREMGISDYLGL